MGERKIPVRRCVGCMEGKEKPRLVRVVKTADGEIALDETGKKAGRGAYLCRNAACFAKAKKKKALERALGCRVPDDVYDALAEKLEDADGT